MSAPKKVFTRGSLLLDLILGYVCVTLGDMTCHGNCLGRLRI